MPKSAEEKAEIRRQAEAHRKPDKDRAAHLNARGKKMTLQDLSKTRPSAEELENYHHHLIAESDRGAAIMAGALVENALELAICVKLVDPGEHTRKSWFEGPNAPFGIFSAKIKLGRALAIYGEHMEGRLVVIKDIRNAFAHTSTPLDFGNPAFKPLCLQLVPDREKVAGKPMKVVFGTACLALTRTLVGWAIAEAGETGKEFKVPFP